MVRQSVVLPSFSFVFRLRCLFAFVATRKRPLNLLKWTKETKQKVEGAQEKKKGDRDPTRCDSAAASSRPLIALKRDKKKTHKKKRKSRACIGGVDRARRAIRCRRDSTASLLPAAVVQVLVHEGFARHNRQAFTHTWQPPHSTPSPSKHAETTPHREKAIKQKKREGWAAITKTKGYAPVALLVEGHTCSVRVNEKSKRERETLVIAETATTSGSCVGSRLPCMREKLLYRLPPPPMLLSTFSSFSFLPLLSPFPSPCLLLLLLLLLIPSFTE